jgi:predicted acetyltransferase
MELRPITEEERPTFTRVLYGAFGSVATDEDVERDAAELADLRRTLAAFEDGTIVGTAAAHAFELTLPGLTSLPAAGVTWVSVLSTHRRRGVLRSLMARQLDDTAARGEPLAVLTASEAGIYRRFGYGPATFIHTVEVDLARVAFAATAPPGDGVRMVDATEANELLPDLFDRSRRRQPGDHQRGAAFWAGWHRDDTKNEGGFGSRFYAVHDEGFVAYRMKGGWDAHGQPDGVVRVDSLVSATDAARAALWRHVCSLDLARRVEAAGRPPDDPLRWLLTDPRAVAVTATFDNLWVRILDVPRALSARTYAAEGRVVLEVSDAFRPQTGGCYALEDGECAATAAAPDLSLAVEDLGSAYLGGVPFSMLAAAGRVREHTAGALARADALFRSHPLPWNQSHF